MEQAKNNQVAKRLSAKGVICLCLATLFMLLTACNNGRVPLSASQFTKKMEGRGFTVYDVTDQFEEGLVSTVLIATNGNYQLEFYITPSIESAAASFFSNRDVFSQYKEDDTHEHTAEEENYNRYQLVAGDTYYALARIGNTFIYCTAPVEYESDINELLDYLGY